MLAVLIGSGSFRTDAGDLDFVADQEALDAFLVRHDVADTAVNTTERGTTYALHLNSPIHWYLPHPTDWDSPSAKIGIIEILVPSQGTAHHRLLQMGVPNMEHHGIPVWIASKVLLAALKKAHLISPHKFDRHIELYADLKRRIGVSVFNPIEHGSVANEIFTLHRKEIKASIKKHPKLNVGKMAFFNEGESYNVFDHDTVHQAVALGDKPAYTLIQDGEVWCSKAKWDKLSEDDKLRCVIEEATVLALERSIIPALFQNKTYRGPEWAFNTALSKVCTTITSGWFRDYAIERFHDAMAGRKDFVSMLFAGIKNGTVKSAADRTPTENAKPVIGQ